MLVLSVGRPERGRWGPLFDDYAERIRRFGIPFEARFVPEVRSGGRFSDAHVKEREARALRDALAPRCRVIALASEGSILTSPEFARRLARWAEPSVAFVIGGPLGLDRAFLESAHAVLSLSSMTFAHELARVVLAEQVFRAVTLQRGVPYHK
jgi:23S rRNA (pseudouridine1915-N3)-methyltransferase